MHLRPSNCLRRFSSTASAGISTAGMAPTAPGPAGPIRKKKKPQTWLRNSLLRESEKQANRRGRPQKYLQNVPAEVFQRRGPPDSCTTTPATTPAQAAATLPASSEGISAIPALQNAAQCIQQQLAGTQIPQQLASSWPLGVMAAAHAAASAPLSACTPVQTVAQQQQKQPEQQQQVMWGLQKQLFATPVLPCVSGNSSDSSASAFVAVPPQQQQMPQQQTQWPAQQVMQQELPQPSASAAIQSCSESSGSSKHISVPPQQFEQQVSLVAALCGIYTSTSSKAPSKPQQSSSIAGMAHTLPIPAPIRCSSNTCSPTVAAQVVASAVVSSSASAKDCGCITSGYEQFRCDGDGASAPDALEGLGDIDQLVEEATGWDGDILSCLLEPATNCLDQCASDSWDGLAGPIVRNVLASPQVDGLSSWDGCLSDVELSDGCWGPAMFLE